MQDRSDLTRHLVSLSAELLAADPTDSEALVRIGAAVEEALEATEAWLPQDQEPLTLILAVLQAVYEKRCPNADAAMMAMATAAAVAAGTAGGRPEEIPDAPAVLAQLRGLAAAEPQAPASAPETSAPQNIAGAAAPQAPSASKPDQAAPASDYAQPFTMPADTDLSLLAEFAVECLDHIAAAEGSLLELESNPDLPEPINVVFRAFHTIKGTSGFLGLDRVQRLAHLAENLLDRAREGKIHIRGGYADLALESCDVLRTLIESVREVQPGAQVPVPPKFPELLAVLANPEAAGVGEESEDAPALRVGDILVGQGRAQREQVEDVAARQGDRKIGESLVEDGVAAAKDVAQALRTQDKLTGRSAGEATIRVGTERLDSLINMVGELVIAQSMVAQDPDVQNRARPRLQRNVAHAGKIIRELQDLSMSLRMVPLKATFQKMARLVRDLARKAGKDVRFVTEGEDTEIDRNMVEVLNDPLVHMMRNSVDHGVESAADRTAAGKEATGTVRLRAYHSAGNVVLVLQDDGKGLNRDKILAKARDRGLVESGKELSESEIFALIFHPGFSTADQVTDISGRGVGMDVVKKGIESLRGRVDVESRPGQGTTFTIRLPLTMAITDGMLVRVGEQRYLLPIVSIERSFQPESETLSTVTGRGEMVLVRGELLPMLRMHRLFTVPAAVTDPCHALLIIIEGEGRRCALMVDELLGQQQVVIKSLGKSFEQVAGISGGAILGDGRVGLILDPQGLLELADRSAASMAA